MLSPNVILQSRYRILRLLGRGGMGTVYEALDERLTRHVALKETHVEGHELRRAFEREARLLANLQHPSLPRVLDHFSEADSQFLVMEFIPGDDLSKMLEKRGRPFPLDEVLNWADQLLNTLEYLHSYVPPVVHRDIKPSNLKLTNKGQIVLLDFGLAKGMAGQMPLPENSLSVSGYSPNYAPLEQIHGERTSPQSDLYSLAATLYQLLTNQKPVDALKRATAVINGESDPLIHINEIYPELPRNVAATLMDALSLQPTRRPASAAIMHAALNDRTEASIQPTQSQPVSSPARPAHDDEATKVSSSFRNDAPQHVEPGANNSDVPSPSETLTQHAASAGPVTGYYELPDIGLLNAPTENTEQDDEELRAQARHLAEKLREFNVTGKIEHICPGPVVTTYEFKPDPGVKYSRITALSEDICLAMRAIYTNIERVPGTSNVGIQIPNRRREPIPLRPLIESRLFLESASKLTIAMGLTIDGRSYVADLKLLPHLLIAGATGSGKSVFINALIISLLYKAKPDEVKLILIDPKRVELGLYADIPHLATPIITDAKRASLALKWAVFEMERRLREMAGWGVRNIEDLNAEILRRNLAQDFDDNGEPWKPLPYIVIVIDELADLMMACADEVEESLTILARKERAVGIHLVLATQRPSAEVITGPIKANFPARLSFHVASKADSRIILDTNGAEDLLGLGDMLFLPPRQEIVRLHGAYVNEAEIWRVVAHVRAQGLSNYDERVMQTEDEALGLDGVSGERDELFEDALRICVEMKRASTSVLQRRLRIGYGRAAEILDMMEREGFIGQADGARPRPVLSRAFETIAEWDEVNVTTEPKEDTAILKSGPFDERPKTAAERVAEFMSEIDPAPSDAPRRVNDPASNDYVSKSTSQESKRKGGWWNSLFGGDED